MSERRGIWPGAGGWRRAALRWRNRAGFWHDAQVISNAEAGRLYTRIRDLETEVDALRAACVRDEVYGTFREDGDA